MGLTASEILLGICAFFLIAIFCTILFPYFLKPKKEEANRYQANIPSAMRDVLIASLTKGQLPAMVIGLLLIIAVLKMPADMIYKLLNDVISLFKSLAFFGWILFFITILYSANLISKAKKSHAKEIANIKEDQKLLEEKLKIDLENILSSKKSAGKK